MRSRSLRCSNLMRIFCACSLDHGQTNNANTAMPKHTGQAKLTSGLIKPVKPRPLAFQITISLSLYMRDRATTMAINKQSVKIVDKCPKTKYPMTSSTSVGLTRPLFAKNSTRISIMVITTVMRTTSEAPKVRLNSFRTEEWNNIEAYFTDINCTNY